MKENIIKKLRNKLGYTKTKLATELGITPPAIGNYERGDRFPAFKIAFKLIDLCLKNGIKVSLEDIYRSKSKK